MLDPQIPYIGYSFLFDCNNKARYHLLRKQNVVLISFDTRLNYLMSRKLKFRSLNLVRNSQIFSFKYSRGLEYFLGNSRDFFQRILNVYKSFLNQYLEAKVKTKWIQFLKTHFTISILIANNCCSLLISDRKLFRSLARHNNSSNPHYNAALFKNKNILVSGQLPLSHSESCFSSISKILLKKPLNPVRVATPIIFK